MQRIEVSPIELRDQKPTEVNGCWFDFFDTHILYHVDFFAEEPIDINDHAQGWDIVYNGMDIIALKKNVAGVEISRSKDKKWGVYIIVDGFAQDLKAYFKKRSEAQVLFDAVSSWLVG